MARMKTTEEAQIKIARKGLNDGKEAISEAMKAIRVMMAQFKAEGRAAEYDEAYGVWVELDTALNGLHRAHKEASKALMRVFPDDGGIIAFGGPR